MDIFRVRRKSLAEQDEIMIFDKFMIAVVVLLMIGGGIAHLASPGSFTGFVFAPLPPTATVLVAGVVQLLIGVAALFPSARARAGLAFAALCLAYVPLHVWDLIRDDPMIAPYPVAVVRVFLQLVFVWMGWRVWNSSSRNRCRKPNN
jgi:uncharacterized membrane protein